MADYQWPGADPAQYVELEQAVQRNCDGSCAGGCPAHKMLDDPKVLEHLAFVKDRAETFRSAEFNVPQRQ